MSHSRDVYDSSMGRWQRSPQGIERGDGGAMHVVSMLVDDCFQNSSVPGTARPGAAVAAVQQYLNKHHKMI